MKRFFSVIACSLILMPLCALFASADVVNECPSVLPALREWEGGTGSFTPDSDTTVYYQGGFTRGDIIDGFFADMLSMTPEYADSFGGKNSISFVFDEAVSHLGDEGYRLEVTKDGATVSATTEAGLFYGGITVVQILYTEGSLPVGVANDYPEYKVRAGMIDAARAWIPLDYLTEITRYMAWYKLNEVHVHINDVGADGVGYFRLESDIKGLTAEQHYTKDEYRAYQKEMARYGVTIITEIDSPGHSTCFSYAEDAPPCLGGNTWYLDITKPETYDFIKKLFAEYMTGDDPVFVAKTVHIGTDEYDHTYGEEMRAYTDMLIDYCNSLGYTPRFWCSFGTSGFDGDTEVSSDAEAYYWNDYGGTLDEILDIGYPFVNVTNAALYCVPTGNYGFPDYYHLSTLYNNWQVNFMNLGGTSRVEADHELLLGACFALWNDKHKSNLGVTCYDLFDRLRGMVCLMAEKCWNGNQTTEIGYEDFAARYEKLSAFSGDSNPGRVLKTPIELDGVTAETDLGASAVGFPNNIEFKVKISSYTDGILFDGDRVSLLLDCDGKGRLGFASEDYVFAFDYKLPLGEDTHLRFTCDAKGTLLIVNDTYYYPAYNIKNKSGNILSTFVFPLESALIGVEGVITDFKASAGNYDCNAQRLNRNLALGAKTEVSALEVDDGRFTADLAVDGNMDTRLSFSAKEDVQYLIVDLGAELPVKRINIAFFEHVSDYEVYVGDGESWELVYTLSGGVPRERITDEIVLDKVYKARYVKYVQLKRNYFAEWNSYYSGGISEFEVYGFDSGEAEAELRAAENIAFELDKSDERRSAILDAAAALEAYLKADNLYESHYNALLADLRTAVENAGEEQEPVSDTEQSEPAESDDPLTGGDIVTFVIAAIIAVAVLAVCIIAVVKKGV